MSAGFNIYGAFDLQASALLRKVFDPGKAPSKEDGPFRIPAYIDYRPIEKSDFFYASGDGRESFQSDFAARASVDVQVGAFSGHVEASYGRKIAQSSQYSFANISYRDTRGTLVLHDPGDKRYLSDDFLSRLAALPDKAEPAHLDLFFDFFKDFGAYFVTQILLGTTLEYYVAVEQSSSLRSEEIKAKAEAEYKALFWSGKASAEMSSDQRWEAYRKNKVARIHIKGGGAAERGALSQIDSGMDSMTPATKDRYEKWQQSAAANPVVMDFRLSGIWEACGAKRRAVEDAFREYGRMMRPLLQLETRTMVVPGDSYLPDLYLGGSSVPASSPPVGKNSGAGGYQLMILDRHRPSVAGVRMNRTYHQSSMSGSGYLGVFDDMTSDLEQAGIIRDGAFATDGVFVVLASFGAFNAFPPPPKFVRLLKEAGAGSQLDTWLASAAQGIGTAHITSDVNYLLVGIAKSGPGAGVELVHLYLMGTKRLPHAAHLDVYFYSLGPGKPFVLGPAERRVDLAAKA